MAKYEEVIYPQLLRKQLSELPYFRAFLRAVEARFYQSLDVEGPVLDMGAGDGNFGARTFTRAIEIGFDPAFRSLQEADSYHFYQQLVNGMGETLPFRAGSFETVVSNSVLEHIPEVDMVLKEMQRVLKKNGRLIMCVPNSNFTKKLSVALFLDGIKLHTIAKTYRRFFNFISRHYHPDDPLHWQRRLEEAGFKVQKQWNYFSPAALRILEWGHIGGLPNLLSKVVFSRWVLFPKSVYNQFIYNWILPLYAREYECPEGAYTFFVAIKT